MIVELSSKEKDYLESKVESFLNEVLFNSDIVSGGENDNREREGIEYIIRVLEERISYY